MNRKEFYARRRGYRIMYGQDDYEYEHCPSKEVGKYWSGMELFSPRRADFPYTPISIWAARVVKSNWPGKTKEYKMEWAKRQISGTHTKVKLP